MRINADFSRSAMIDTLNCDWVGSPQSGVDRIMLDRIGDEVARATSIVRYAPGSSFSRHEHAMGEEFLVLDGIFSDEHADYETGTYVRNPPGSGHAPHSIGGCRILVKLRQFDSADLEPVVIKTQDSSLWQQSVDAAGEFLPLHQFNTEVVQMLRLQASDEYALPDNGSEIFVVTGSLQLAGEDCPAESWLRFPIGTGGKIIATEGCVLWMKRGHLPNS